MRYMIFIGEVLENTYATYDEAENRVDELLSKYDFLKPEVVRIEAYTI